MAICFLFFFFLCEFKKERVFDLSIRLTDEPLLSRAMEVIIWQECVTVWTRGQIDASSVWGLRPTEPSFWLILEKTTKLSLYFYLWTSSATFICVHLQYSKDTLIYSNFLHQPKTWVTCLSKRGTVTNKAEAIWTSCKILHLIILAEH